VICAQCGNVFRKAFPESIELERVHSEVYSKQAMVSAPEMESPRIALENHAKFLRKRFPAAKTVLDYGAGTGIFAQILQTYGFSVHGVEFSHEARKIALEQRGFVFAESLQNLPLGSKFDLITLVEVIEHLPNPKTTLGDLHAFATSVGKIYLTTPNRKGLSCLVRGANWREARKKYHLSLFDSTVLSTLLLTTGWRNIEVIKWGPITTNHAIRMSAHRFLQLTGLYGGLRVSAEA
jgi:SAM-dependent methyltransferase